MHAKASAEAKLKFWNQMNSRTIHTLHKHIFRIFGPPYVRMFLVLRISKNWHFLMVLQPLSPTSAYVMVPNKFHNYLRYFIAAASNGLIGGWGEMERLQKVIFFANSTDSIYMKDIFTGLAEHIGVVGICIDQYLAKISLQS